MLIGAIIFCAFIMLCIENMLIFRFTKKEENRNVIVIVLLAIATVGAERILGLDGYFIYIFSGGLVIYFALLFKNFQRAVILVIYGASFIIGFYSVTSALLEISTWLAGFPANLSSAIISIAIILLLRYLLKGFLSKRADMNTFNHRIMHLLIIISSVVLIFVYLNNAIDGTYILLGNWYLSLTDIGFALFFVCIWIMFVLILRYVSRESRLRTELLISEASKKYIQDLEESYKALRTMKHDYVNIMASMKLRIDNGDMAGLAKYYYDELSALNNDLLHQDKLMEDLHNVHISEVKSILIYKCSVAAGHGIEVNIEAREPIESIGVSTAIICQILGILLDNAIDATREADNKILCIAIIKNPNSKVFIIKNTWINRDIELGKLSELGYTTKGKGRGVGLYTIRNYTEKINSLYLETELDKEYFSQTLSVKDDR